MLMIYTGDGKGKTSAALGTCFRALGYGWKIVFIQFMKGTWDTGELKSAVRFDDLLEIIPMGKGFYKILDDHATEEDHRLAAETAFQLGMEKIQAQSCRLLVLDEILVAIQTGLLDEQTVMENLKTIPPSMHVILTGRGATPGLIRMADLVSEMKEIKHPFTQGHMAQKGIDF